MPASANTLHRRVASVAFVDSSEITVDIPRVQDITSLEVHIRGSLVIGTAAATALAPESPANLISRFDFIANGKDVLDQVSGARASIGNYARGFTNNNTAPGLTVATHDVDAVYMLDRDMIDGIRPKDSSFQAYLTNLLQLRMITGNGSTNDATNNLVAPDATTTCAFTGTVDVYVDSTDELAGDRGEAKAVKKVTRQTQTVTGAQTALEFRLPTGNHIRMVSLRTLDDGAPTNALVTDMECAIDGVDVRFKGTFKNTRIKNARDKNLHVLSIVPTGHAIIDFAPNGKMSYLLDATRASECKLIISNDAPAGTTGTIEVTIEEYILPVRSNG